MTDMEKAIRRMVNEIPAPIVNIDKETAKKLGAELAEAARVIAAKYGLSADHGGGRFSDTEYTAKTVFRVTDTAVIEAKNRAEFCAYCKVFDLIPDDYGREFTVRGKRYRVTGLMMNRVKFPIRVFDYAAGKETLFNEIIIPVIKAAR